MARLRSQVILIGGDDDALGDALVARCLDEGARLAVLAANAAHAATLRARLGADALVMEGARSSPAAQQRAVAATLARYGALDGYIGHGACWDHDLPLARLPGDARLVAGFEALFADNVLAYLCAARAVAGALAARHGCLLFTLAPAALAGGHGGPLATAAAQAGAGLVRELARELAPHVRVNGVCVQLPAATRRGPFAAEATTPAAGDVLAPRYLPDAWAQAGTYVRLLAGETPAAASGELVSSDDTPIEGLLSLA